MVPSEYCVQVFPFLVHLEENKGQFVKLFLHYLCEFHIHFVCEKILFVKVCLHLCKLFHSFGERIIFVKVYLNCANHLFGTNPRKNKK